MFYSRLGLPLISLDKIKISKNSKYSLDMEVSLIETSTLGLDDYRTSLGKLNSIKIVLAVLDTRTENYLTRFQNIHARHRALTEFKRVHKGYIKEASVQDFASTAFISQKEAAKNKSVKVVISKATLALELPELSDIEESKIKNMHLVAFLQSQEVVSDPPVYIATPSANIEYELILTRGTSSELQPPSKRRSFYANSTANPGKMVPYTGPSHYHSKQTPGPSGYVGWMASRSNGTMGPRLTIREVENYKVILERTLDPLNKDKKKARIPADFANKSTGTDLRRHALPQLSKSQLISPSSTNNKMSEDSQATLEKNKKSFFYGLGNGTAHISTKMPSPGADSHSSGKYDNYQGLVFGVDLESMLKYRSRFGSLLNFHYKNGNMNIVVEALRKSNIHKISVKRARLSDRPNLKARKGTFEYTTRNNNQESKNIVTSFDKPASRGIRGSLQRFRSLDGEIQELNLVGLSPQGEVFNHPDCKYMRQFLFKDFDLFHNVQEGTYTYSVELELVDGMQKHLENTFSRLQKSIIQYEKYLRDTSMSMKIQARKQRNKESNPDTVKNNLVTKSNISFINSAVDIYFDALNLLEGDNIVKNKKEGIKNSISPINADIESVNKFLASLKSLSGAYMKTLNIKDSSPAGRRSSSNLTGAIPGIIQESFKTGSRVKAFNSSKIIASYLDNLGNSPMLTVTALKSRLSLQRAKNYNAAYIPEKLVTIHGQEYEVVDAFNAGKEKRVSEIIFNEVAKIKDLSDVPSAKTRNLKLKLSVLESPGADKKGLLDKDDLYYFKEAQKLGSGMKLKIRERGTRVTKGSNSSESKTTPDISSKLQKAIYEVSKEIDNKDLVLDQLEKDYKSASSIRNQLDTMYDGVMTSIKIGEKVLSVSSKDKIYQNKFKGKAFDLVEKSKNGKLSFTDEYSARLKSVLPGVYDERIDINNVRLGKAPRNNQTGKRYILMKLENVFSKDILQSNNLFFVEV